MDIKMKRNSNAHLVKNQARPRFRWQFNVKICLSCKMLNDVVCIHVVPDSDQYTVFINTVLNRTAQTQDFPLTQR
jgi:hypothetical protein